MQLSPPFSLPNFSLLLPFHLSLKNFNFCSTPFFDSLSLSTNSPISLSLSEFFFFFWLILVLVFDLWDYPRCVALSMPESSSSSFTNCDLPLLLFSLLVAQFGTSSELLISRSIVFVCFSISRRFKACFFHNLFYCGSSIQDLYLIAN